jgi:glutamate carboxypeptidase
VVTSDLVQHFRGQQEAMLAELQELVETESPSRDIVALSTCAVLLSAMGGRILGHDAEQVVVDGRVHLRWAFGAPRVALLCHFDTVWPVGTIERMPFRVQDGRAYGPGVFDMKASIVQSFHALSRLADLDGVELLVTSDEEIGSPTSRSMIEALAKRVDAVLVIEPSHAGALKIGRKGVGMYRLRVVGRAAHAGFPHEGANATVELAHQVLAISALAREDVGTSVTPTTADSGTTHNVVPGEAHVAIDVRVPDAAEQERVDAALRALAPVLPGTRLELEGGPNRPPLEPTSTAALFAVAQKVAHDVGLGELGTAIVGGASDGNFAAAVGAPTLDGLGCIGDGAHADHEHIVVSALPERTALLAALVEQLLQRP